VARLIRDHADEPVAVGRLPHGEQGNGTVPAHPLLFNAPIRVV
jgi:hypothetical protein